MREVLSQSLQNLRANKLRSLLTMFGIMWGVISIVILSAVGEGFERGNQAVLEELGRNIVIIRNGRTSLQAGGERAGRVVKLTIADVHALERQARLLEQVSPELMRGAVRVKSAFNTATLQMSGVWPSFQRMRTLEVSKGRLMNEADNAEGRRVLVMGHEASRLLFADRDPVGQRVALNGISYTVVGRVRKKNQDSNYTGQDDERLFVPYEAMRKDFPLPGAFDTPDNLSAIIAAPHPWIVEKLRRDFERTRDRSIFGLDGHTPVEAELRAILAARHGFDPADREAVSMWNTAIESVFFSKMMSGMGEFFLAVSIVTLVLGGIGVTNIMLVAVKERTKEIGVRKTLGATSRLIQWQFFSEGLFLTSSSGLLGLIVGYGLCALVNHLPLPARFSGMIITWPTVTFSIAAIIVVGVAAATYPARRAAALEPVDALRYEM